MTSQLLTPISLARAAHPNHRWSRFHFIIQEHLLKLAFGMLKLADGSRCKRLMIRIGPQHAKSTLSSQLLPATLLNQSPCLKLILLSYSAELATSHGSVARDHVREFFPGILDTDKQAQHHWKTKAGGYLISAGIQGSVTGRAANGVIIDDPFKGSEDSSSPVIRNKVWSTYSSVAETRLSPDGWVALIGTPWHSDDLQSRLLETEPEKWLVLRFPAFAEENDVLEREYGDVLWPERYSLEWYEDKRRSFELRGLSHLWNALYQCNPTGDSSLRAFNDPSYFTDDIWSEGVGPKATALRVLALDPSKSKTGKTGDFNSFADVLLDVNRHLHCRMHLDRQPLTATYAQALSIVKAAEQAGQPFNAMMVETQMMQEAIYLHLKEIFAAQAPYLLMIPHQTESNQSKFSRIKIDLEPLLAQHRLHFVGQTISNRLTLQQVKEMPNGSHDDGADSISMATKLINLLTTGAKNPPKTQLILRA